MFRLLSAPLAEDAIEAIAFDLDGTLLDSETGWFKTFQAVMAAHEQIWTLEDHLMEMSSSGAEWYERMEAKLGLGWEFDRYKNMVHSVRDIVDPDHPRLFPGVTEMLEQMFGRWSLAIASSGSKTDVTHNLNAVGIEQYFSVIVGGDEVKNAKPAPDVYIKAAKTLGLDPRHCLAVEDSMNGVRSAVEAGLQVVALSHPDFPIPDSELESCDGVITDIQELPHWLEFRLALTPERDRETSRAGLD